MQTVQAFTLEELHSRRYDAAVEESFAAAMRRTECALDADGASGPCWCSAPSPRAVDRRARGASRRDDRRAAGQFLLYAVFVARRRGSLSEQWGEVQRAAGAMERLVELQQRRAGDRGARAAGAAAGAGPRRDPLRACDASAIRPDPDARRSTDFDLAIAPGETVAFVGPSGAGKSTMFQLLLRFYDPEPGRILIDGVDIAHGRSGCRCAAASAWCRRTRCCSAPARARTSAMAGPDATDAEIEAAAARGCGRRIHAQAAAGIRHLPRRARHAAVGRPAPAHRHRARHPAGSADPAARRGHQRAGRRKRAAGAGRRWKA